MIVAFHCRSCRIVNWLKGEERCHLYRLGLLPVRCASPKCGQLQPPYIPEAQEQQTWQAMRASASPSA